MQLMLNQLVLLVLLQLLLTLKGVYNPWLKDDSEINNVGSLHSDGIVFSEMCAYLNHAYLHDPSVTG